VVDRVAGEIGAARSQRERGVSSAVEIDKLYIETLLGEVVQSARQIKRKIDDVARP